MSSRSVIDFFGESPSFPRPGNGLLPDAMGQDVSSALTATLGMAGLRNSRRAGHRLGEQADEASAAIAQNTPARGAFITAVLGRLDPNTGECELINAGHIAPVLMRDGERPPPWTCRRSSGHSRRCTLARAYALWPTPYSPWPGRSSPTPPRF
jgi:serine phosphatase RsbU (regulator of sigma subunit)